MNPGASLPYGVTVLTPWMQRQADNAVYTFELIDNPDGVDVEISVLEKNSEDYGSGTATIGPSTFTTGFLEIDTSTEEPGQSEMIRFKIAVGNPGLETPNGTGIVYRLLQATWYDAATPTI